MTIELVTTRENIVFSKSDVIVNAVNCKGVMGAGMAANFKEVFPDMFAEYKADCNSKTPSYKPGGIVVYDIQSPPPGVHANKIINVATKDHWCDPSTYDWVFSGINMMHLYMLVHLHNPKIQSITVPPIGCGHGGLEWPTVRDHLLFVFDKLPSHMLVRILSPHM